MKNQETNYETKKIQIKNTIFSVVIASGLNNYVSIRKETNNPWKSGGKRFENFDEAIKNYKSANMKVELLKLQTGLC
jgi:hypothetical protein